MVRYVVIVLLLSAAQASPIRPASTAPEPGKWTKAASMDTPRAYFSAVTLPNSSILIVGGSSTVELNGESSAESNRPGRPVGAVRARSTALGTTQRYEPATNTWHTGPSLNTPRYNFCLAILGNEVFAVGGLGASETRLQSLEVLNLQTGGGWERGAAMPVVSGKVSCTAAPEIGIFVWEAETSKIVDYDHDTKSWGTNVPPVPSNGLTSGRLTVLQNGSVLFVGGYRSGRGVDATYLYTPSLTAWSSGQHMLAGRFAAGLLTLRNGDVLVIGGGQDQAVPSKTVERLDIAEGQWHYVAELPVPLFAHAATTMANGSVFVAGGYPPSRPPLSSAVYIYTAVSATTQYRCESNACVIVAEDGVPKEECESVCGPPVPQKFDCIGGRCSLSANGVDKDVCERVCRPAEVSPFQQ